MKHWSDLSSNPNDMSIIKNRNEFLKKVKNIPIYDRNSYLMSLADGKNVLDVGVVDHDSSTHSKVNWLHKKVQSVSNYCLGIDVLADQIYDLKLKGYNVIGCDITDPSDRTKINKKFDLILCGELFEHLDNPSALFHAAKEWLDPVSGKLVVTTPYPFSIWTMARHTLGRPRDNVDHIMFAFPSGMLELAARAGFNLDSYRGTLIAGSTWKHRFLYRLHPFLKYAINENICCTTMIYEFVMH